MRDMQVFTRSTLLSQCALDFAFRLSRLLPDRQRLGIGPMSECFHALLRMLYVTRETRLCSGNLRLQPGLGLSSRVSGFRLELLDLAPATKSILLGKSIL